MLRLKPGTSTATFAAASAQLPPGAWPESLRGTHSDRGRRVGRQDSDDRSDASRDDVHIEGDIRGSGSVSIPREGVHEWSTFCAVVPGPVLTGADAHTHGRRQAATRDILRYLDTVEMDQWHGKVSIPLSGLRQCYCNSGSRRLIQEFQTRCRRRREMIVN